MTRVWLGLLHRWIFSLLAAAGLSFLVLSLVLQLVDREDLVRVGLHLAPHSPGIEEVHAVREHLELALDRIADTLVRLGCVALLGCAIGWAAERREAHASTP